MKKNDLKAYIRDALRYRELRKHRNRGYPQPGVPYANGWQVDEDSENITDIGYIRERQLDDQLDEAIALTGTDVDDAIDSLYEDLFKSPYSDK